MQRDIVVIGSGFAGLTAALELSRKLAETETITVVSASSYFIYLPSLIWVVQGWRELEDISFAVAPVLAEAGINFINTRLEQINPERRLLTLSDGRVMRYDKLILATGGEWDWGLIPGLWPKPHGHLISIFSAGDVLAARPYWQELLANPGPAVVGLLPGASLYGAIYEFAFMLAAALRKQWGPAGVDITFVTPEPFLGHFGHNGIGNSKSMLEGAFSQYGIQWLTNVRVTELTSDSVVMADQRRLASKFTVLAPPYRGIKPVREVPSLLADEQGRIPVDPYYHTVRHPAIFAVGGAVQVKPVGDTWLPLGVFIPGTVSAEMGRIAANNLAADLWHGQPIRKTREAIDAFYVLDSGSQGLFITLGPQSWLNFQINLPGPWSHWAKVIAEKHQLWQLQT